MAAPSLNRVVTRIAARPVLRSQPDERLVRLAQAGHAAAFEAIVQRYRRPLHGYCRRLLPDSRAEDAVQQTFLSAYRALPGAGDVQLRAWLYRIAHNAAVDALRRPGWNDEQLDPTIDGVERPDQAVLRRERFSEVMAAVQGLPDRQRDAIVLRELEGRSHEEIADELGLSRGGARQLIARARSNVRAAAAALIPPWLPERLLSAPGSSDLRIAEIATGGTFAGIAAKAGVAALATGAVVAGGVSLPARPPGEGRAAAAPPPAAAEPHAVHAAAETPRPSGGPARSRRALAPVRERRAPRIDQRSNDVARGGAPAGTGRGDGGSPDRRAPDGGDDTSTPSPDGPSHDMPETPETPETPEAPETPETPEPDGAPDQPAPDGSPAGGDEAPADAAGAPAPTDD